MFAQLRTRWHNICRALRQLPPAAPSAESTPPALAPSRISTALAPTRESLSAIAATLGSRDWVRANHARLLAPFPREWTPAEQINWLQVRFHFKSLGIDYRSDAMLVECFTLLTRAGLLDILTTRGDTTFIRRGTPPANL